MTLQQLRQVITIADSGSLNEAARKLYVSQPNLSGVLKDLEKEIGITLFLRSNRGISLTPEGKEFIGFARQVVEQYALLEDRYIGKKAKKVFSVSAQHYSFAVKAFVETVKRVGMDKYEFAMHETRTGQVIDNVKNMTSELGILYLSDFNEPVLRKIFAENSLVFTELFACDTYVYLWKGHPLAGKKEISMAELAEYPCLSFEQGDSNSFYFAEEMLSTLEYKRLIKADDRATMLNLMVGLNGYTLCSGIISEELNGSDYAAIPLKESQVMHIGYVRHKDVRLSEIGTIYLEEIRKTTGTKREEN
ncbi:MAG: LysR family transcriptional regulator [Lachnospiraceae bacterium]|jgi:DNA-binding transcriptional LysR family regulator|nr:LysR family transcriptional regulator [Lachnospiraceae bacterium]